MIALSPSKLISNPDIARPVSKLNPDGASSGGTWFRLARTSDGILCLEFIFDETLRTIIRLGLSEEWAFCAEVSRHIAVQLTDAEDPDQVARVLDRAIHVLGYR